MIDLRPHQVEAVAAVEADWERGAGRTAIVHATGTGKTTTFSAIVGRWLERNPKRRALLVAHRIELVDQGARRLAAQLGRPVGVVMGQRNQTLPRAIMASVPTLRSERRRRMIRDVGLVVIDECHHAAADSYLGVLEHYGAMGTGPAAGRAVALGVTATMSRGDELALGDVWSSIAHVYGTPDAIRDGWLKRPVGIAVRVADLDLRRVRTTGGDYADGALGEAIEGSLAPKRIAEAYREHAADRQGFAFAPTVHSAEVIRDALRDEGFTCELVHGKTPGDARRRILDDFRAGRVQILSNCGVFTEGTDLPMASVVVIARPTMHSGLYVQMAGRGLRPWCPVHEGDAGNLLTPCCDREHRTALVLDVVGASRRHSLAARIELFGPEAAERIEADEVEADGEIDTEELFAEVEEPVALDFEPEYVDGALAYDVIDLFGNSPAAWMQTRAGVWFLEAGQRYIAILPSPLGYPKMDVISMDRHIHGTGQWLTRSAESLVDAMAVAEQSVTTVERLTAARGRSWRAKPASGGQLRIAAQLGVSTEGTAGEVSSRISAVLATRRIDPYIPSYVFTGSR